jgi:triosephosphate isomerase
VSLMTNARSAAPITSDRQDRRIGGVNLKMYFGLQQTYRWLETVAELCGGGPVAGRLDMFVMPSFPALSRAAEILDGTGIALGAQNAAAGGGGAQTGEISAAMLAELGCQYLLVGHAERRDGFHEDDDVVARKTSQANAAGLVPVLCVGERDHVSTDEALAVCLRQLGTALRAVDSEVVIAYEPAWAIGAAQPAPADHVRRICSSLRDPAVTGLRRARVVYGGAAGLGTFDTLTPAIDGLFLGRFAHEPQRFAEIAAEIAAVPAPSTAQTRERRSAE